MLRLDSVSFSYHRPILKNISFEIETAQFIGIVGNSGAGKTTLLKLIAGLLDTTSGSIFFEEKKVKGPSFQLIPGHNEIQLVNQDFGLDIYHTVKENIREKILYLPKKERDEFVVELLELMELRHLENQKANSISGGEQQRLALARALACEPKLILLDEPFVHLDGRLRMKISNYLLKMKKNLGTSFILVSHDGIEMLSLADKIIHFSDGEIKKIATPRECYFSPSSKEEGELFGVINTIEMNGEIIYFRPTEFELNENTSNRRIKINYIDSQFAGIHYVNYFVTEKNEEIILFHKASMKNEKEISIKKGY